MESVRFNNYLYALEGRGQALLSDSDLGQYKRVARRWKRRDRLSATEEPGALRLQREGSRAAECGPAVKPIIRYEKIDKGGITPF